MIKRGMWLTSTIIARVPLAFVSTLAPVPPGSVTVNHTLIKALVAKAEVAAGQGIPSPTIEDELGKRDEASQWMLDYWDLTDDIVAGYDAIKAGGQKYLPKFADEPQADYDVRLANGEFTNVYRDIVESLSAKPFEEEITVTIGKDDKGEPIELDESLKKFLEDVDGAGNNITTFSATVFFNGINSAIDWIYVDYPNVDTTVVRTRADEKTLGIRPFWSHVLGRNILEAKSEVIGGEEILTYLRILEPGKPNHIRLFERDDAGVVYWALFEEKILQDGKTKQYTMIDTGIITIGVIPLVPFVTGRRDGRTFKFFPMMRDAADVQKQLYRQECGLAWARTMSGYPMLAANGIKPQMEADGKTPKKVAVGPNRVLYSVPDGGGNVGNWGYVSPDASIMTFLQAGIEAKMNQLRELGRQPLTAQSSNLTVITTAYAAGKSKSAIGACANRLKDTLENALLLTCMWMSIKDYEPEVKVYDEFDNYATDKTSDLGALATARASRDISGYQYTRELMRRSTLEPDFNYEQDQEKLLEETPSDGMGDGEDTNNNNDPKKKPPLKAVK